MRTQGPKKAVWLGVGAMALVPMVLSAVVLLATGPTSPAPDRRRGEERTRGSASERSTAGQQPRPVADPRPRSPKSDEPRESKEVPDEPENVLVNAKLEEARSIENTDPERSRALLREVLEADPDNLTALSSLSTKLLIDEDHDEAHRLAARCDALDPGNATCQNVDKLAIVQSADLERLAGGFRRCLVENPAHPECLGGLVSYHLSKGAVSDAALFLGRLTQHDPHAPQTLYAAGRLQAAGGEYKEAARLFRAACVDLNYEGACVRHEILAAEGW